MPPACLGSPLAWSEETRRGHEQLCQQLIDVLAEMPKGFVMLKELDKVWRKRHGGLCHLPGVDGKVLGTRSLPQAILLPPYANHLEIVGNSYPTSVLRLRPGPVGVACPTAAPARDSGVAGGDGPAVDGVSGGIASTTPPRVHHSCWAKVDGVDWFHKSPRMRSPASAEDAYMVIGLSPCGRHVAVILPPAWKADPHTPREPFAFVMPADKAHHMLVTPGPLAGIIQQNFRVIVRDAAHTSAKLQELGVSFTGLLLDVDLLEEATGDKALLDEQQYTVNGGDRPPAWLMQLLPLAKCRRWLDQHVQLLEAHGYTIRDLFAASSAVAARGEGDARPICYVPSRRMFGTAELWERLLGPEATKPRALRVSVEIEPLLALIPSDLFSDYNRCMTEALTHKLLEVVLDLGKRPRYKCSGEREPIWLHDDENVLVTSAHLAKLSASLRIGHDNRAGIDGTLHRISVILNKDEKVIGATLRVGRHIRGNVEFLRDILTDDPRKAPSILVLGPPGTGKTTLIRELARELTEALDLEVVIIDTSNEIAGDGDVSHPSVGRARRLMVRTRDEQADRMIEAVQNHTPEVMIIDEIGRKKEVEAASTVKERGVAMIGSAHGDFRSLLRNRELKRLIGGARAVTVGDQAAKETGSKVRIVREASPVFDVIVELQAGKPNCWTLYHNVVKVVDAIYDRKPYQVERRCRDDEGRLYSQTEDRACKLERDMEEGLLGSS